MPSSFEPLCIWQRWSGVSFNERQIKLLNRLLDGFDGKLSSGKWAAIAKCSADTALRDISDLLAKGVLVKSSASGRSTHYELAQHGVLLFIAHLGSSGSTAWPQRA